MFIKQTLEIKSHKIFYKYDTGSNLGILLLLLKYYWKVLKMKVFWINRCRENM